MNDKLTDSNFILYCARYYDNPQCSSTEEFIEDLDRVKYIKRLISKYIETNELNERLILNHIILLRNVFGDQVSRILYLKLKQYFECVKPFLILLDVLPDVIYNVGDETIIYTDVIPMNQGVIKALRLSINE